MADLSKNERIKAASNYLRGTLEEGLAAPITGAIAEDDTQLTKFHGLYLQGAAQIVARGLDALVLAELSH